MRTLLLPMALAASLASPAALGAPDCHTAAEIEAAEAIRFHTELMIGSLACREDGAATDTYTQYQAFTRRHADTLARFEQVLIARFGRLYDGDPVARFDDHRTRLANELADWVSQQPRLYYCAGQRALLDAWQERDDDVLASCARRRRHMAGKAYQMCGAQDGG